MSEMVSKHANAGNTNIRTRKFVADLFTYTLVLESSKSKSYDFKIYGKDDKLLSLF